MIPPDVQWSHTQDLHITIRNMQYLHNMYRIPRAIGQVSMPPNQHKQMIPPPPPPPPTSASITPDAISGNAGNICQYFGGYNNHF